MSHDTDYSDLEAPDDYQVSSQYNLLAGGLTVVGAIGFLLMLALGDPTRAWRAYLVGWWFTLSLALSGPFIVATQYVSHGSWGTSLRRIPEAFGAFLLPATVLGLIALLGAEAILPWIGYDASEIPHHVTHILHKKSAFLNMTGLVIGTAASLIAITALYAFIRSVSLKQDETGEGELYETNKRASAVWLVVFVTGLSVLSWYWLMSLEPLWFSTMWQVYAFAGLFQSGLALTAIITIWLIRDGTFDNLVGEYQIHSIGQLVFAFTVFYAYISFCQYLLIWYANIPEEALWYVHRINDVGWFYFITLWTAKFIIPFFALLPQDHKKNKGNILMYMCWLLLAAQLFEIWYWVDFSPVGPDPAVAPTIHIPWLEVIVTMGFVGLFMLTVGWALSRAKIIPINDPFLHESIAHLGGHGEDDSNHD